MMAFRRCLERRRVVVNLLSGRAFDGVLYARRGPLLILRNAVMHERGAEPAPVDGDVVVERNQVEFIQVTG
jgi:small nuclear ribonucleoprotein (snRNP)-like protein